MGYLGGGGRYDLTGADDARCSTLFTSATGLENAKQLVTAYKTGKIQNMTPDLWSAKKIIDSTIHPGTERLLRHGTGQNSR